METLDIRRDATVRPARTRATALTAALAAAAAAGILSGCGGKANPDFLGSAVVEAETFQATAMVQGRLAALFKQEGQDVAAGELLAVVDTVPLALQLREAEAGLTEVGAGRRSQENQNRAAQAELRGLERDYGRIAPLVKEGALPAQQGDKLSSSLDAARLKLTAGKDMLASLAGREEGIRARMESIRDQIRRCYLRSAAPGRILTRYKNPDEVVGPGQPIYEIGRDDTLEVDFFVPQPLLADIRLGQAVRLRLDRGDGEVYLPAAVSWIGQEAEFSPRNIQTRESRNELVFRVRALAANKDGLLKRGLPVEVWKGR